MKDYLQKIKIWFNKLKAGRVSYDKGGLKPLRDWRIILITTSIIIFILAIFAFYFYIQIESGKLFVSTNEVSDTQLKINDSLLKKTVDELNTRESSTAQIKSGQITAPDPSL